MEKVTKATINKIFEDARKPPQVQRRQINRPLALENLMKQVRQPRIPSQAQVAQAGTQPTEPPIPRARR